MKKVLKRKKIEDDVDKESVKTSPSHSLAKIRVVGIGGAGGNAINFMLTEEHKGSKDIEYIAMNTDKQDLDHSRADKKIQLGEKITKGLGAGANPEIGKLGAQEDRDKIKEAIIGTDLLFITAGMGGGTGTGAAPVVAEVARELGILTVAVVTRPFSFEGLKRTQNSTAGINELAQYVDTLVVIPNEKLFELPNKTISLIGAFEAANSILKIGMNGISDLITKKGYINLDFADIRAVMSNSGVAMLGFGHGEGEDRAKMAAEQALRSPLLERPVNGARRILLNITGGVNLGLNEASQIANMVTAATGESAHEVIFGTVIDPAMDKAIKVTIIATDFIDRPDMRFSSPERTQNPFYESESGNEDNGDNYKDSLNIPAFLRRNRK